MQRSFARGRVERETTHHKTCFLGEKESGRVFVKIMEKRIGSRC